VNLLKSSTWYCSLPCTLFNFLRLILSIWNLCELCLFTARLTKIMHVQIFAKNAVNAFNWYSSFRWYLPNTPWLVTLCSIVRAYSVFSSFAKVSSCPQWESLTLAWLSQKCFSVIHKLCFLHCCLTVCFSYNHNIWRSCVAKQNFMFTGSVDDTFKCDEPTIHRIEQTANT
jgi:hypothetical protein